jgi:hypothetical protein
MARTSFSEYSVPSVSFRIAPRTVRVTISSTNKKNSTKNKKKSEIKKKKKKTMWLRDYRGSIGQVRNGSGIFAVHPGEENRNV